MMLNPRRSWALACAADRSSGSRHIPGRRRRRRFRGNVLSCRGQGSLIEGSVALIGVTSVLRPSCMSAWTGTGWLPGRLQFSRSAAGQPATVWPGIPRHWSGSGVLGQSNPEACVVGRPHRNGPGRGCVSQSCPAAGVEKICEVHERKLRADLVGQLVVELTWRAGAVKGFLVTDEFGEEVLLARCQRNPLDVEKQRDDGRHDGGRNGGRTQRYQQPGYEC